MDDIGGTILLVLLWVSAFVVTKFLISLLTGQSTFNLGYNDAMITRKRSNPYRQGRKYEAYESGYRQGTAKRNKHQRQRKTIR